MNCIPNTDEKYISISRKVGDIQMRFIDSKRFLLASLENWQRISPRTNSKRRKSNLTITLN